MKKKKRFLIGTVIAISSMFLTGGLPIMAEDTATSSINSSANIAFENDNEPTRPVDPITPGKPGDPGDIEESNDPNTLAIIAYPKTMSFGHQKVGHGVQEYESLLLRPNVQIKDYRGAAAKGWNLSVGLSEFVNDEIVGPGHSVKGYLTLENTEMFFAGNSYEAEPSTVNSKIIVGSNEQALIASAKEDEGRGIWGFHWYAPNSQSDITNSNVKLGMNSNKVVEGSYTANLEWTLSATPN